jgi:arylsulfatase A-like enzyme
LAKEADRAMHYGHRNNLPAHRAGLHRADKLQLRPKSGRDGIRDCPAPRSDPLNSPVGYILPMTLRPRLVCVFTALALSGFAAESAPRPNILLIVSDDQGYADTGFQGSKDIVTPHLDRLAASGIRFTNGYVTHPYCSPTRAGLMTGRYQQRFGHERNPFFNPADHREGLPVSETLLPARLQPAGYVTGWIGKWHLGAAPEFSPRRRGFAETYGFIGGGHRFREWQVNAAVEYQVPIERNGEPVAAPAHLTADFGREGAAFVRRHAAQPWFLYLAFNAPHTPHEPTPERLARFASITNPVRQKYAAQVSLMDDAIGETLAALRETGQERRTLVFFFSDNGGPIAVNGSDNTPLRGAKGNVYEGGVRVPFLMAWPGRLAAGKTDDRPVSSVDVFATTLAVAGVAMPADRKYDSVNLLPYLTGEKTGAPHDRLFWRSGALLAVREGRWKLVRGAGAGDELYDLAADVGETKDLGAAQPAVKARLAAALDAWNGELVEPAFPGLGGQPNKGKKAAKKQP